MEAELQAVPWMGETALFAVSERLLRAFTRGRLLMLVNLRTGVSSEQLYVGELLLGVESVLNPVDLIAAVSLALD